MRRSKNSNSKNVLEVFIFGFRQRRIFHESIQNSTSEHDQSCALLLKEENALSCYLQQSFALWKYICTIGKNPNDIPLMEISDGKVQMVLNLRFFPCKKKKKDPLKCMFTNTGRELRRRKGHSRNRAVAAF